MAFGVKVGVVDGVEGEHAFGCFLGERWGGVDEADLVFGALGLHMSWQIAWLPVGLGVVLALTQVAVQHATLAGQIDEAGLHV